ncbi:hypothetical protein [Luteimonas kalidii]|uniref:Uncharacterized protein n=1 Tax=Luteimonas kalidii TaxID=3042025 RepID=A0ABT6JY85_9GAMM|nr:hypothetical protein [Luteimonas kalidii]MDH5835440.1 hypothetical protein [Luteimonas kalidii]
MVDIIAVRTDGFGQRLKVMLQAMKLASENRIGMKFLWDEKKGAYGSFHSCGDVNEIFSSDFVERHYIKQKPATVPWRRGINYSAVGLDIALRKFDGDAGECFREQFESIGFAPRMQNAIDLARRPDVARASAIHLRGGDILYGELRKHAFTHQDKVIPLPVAKKMIASSDGKRWVVFAQDLALEDELRSYSNVVISSDLRADLTSNAEKTVFDIVLMSRCEQIYGGTSAVCDMASIISGKIPIRLSDIFSSGDVLSAISEDSKYRAGEYDNLLMASLKTSLYYYSARDPSDRALLEEGAVLDPGNPGFPVLYFFALCSDGRFSEAEELAKDALKRKKASAWLGVIMAFMSRPAIRQKVFTEDPGNLSMLGYHNAHAIVTFSRACSSGQPALVGTLEQSVSPSLDALVAQMQVLLGGRK